MGTRPTAGRRAVEILLQAELPTAGDKRLVLVDARYEGETADTEFTVRVDGTTRRVVVSDQDSALGVADAWHRHRTQTAADGDCVLVITGTVPADQLGWDVRAHAVRRHPLAVDRVDLVKQLFGVHDLDARMAGEKWLLDALLDAEPDDGWPQAGAVLTRDRAVRALVSARLGLGEAGSDPQDIDADALFSWTRSPSGPGRFAALPADERAGIGQWLAQTVGAAAPTLLALAADGRGGDALPLGALASAALAKPAVEAAGFALGGLFGASLPTFDALRPFADAATGVLTRWIAQAEGGGPRSTEDRDRVRSVLDRADQLAAEARLSPLLGDDRLLPSGYRGRLQALAAALDGPAKGAEAALQAVTEHRLARLEEHSTRTAVTAVRLVRWLKEPLPQAEPVGRAVRRHLASSGWADLAVAVLAEGDSSRDTSVGEAYHRLIRAVITRRDRLDEQFARSLALWTEGASQQAPGGALLVEDVLTEAVAPLAREAGRPLVLVVDGMSADVAVQLVGTLDRRAWTEIVPKPAQGDEAMRQAAVAMLPSLTRTSRTSLLCGQPAEGGQSTERAGFASLWKKRHRNGTLFHKGSYEGAPGHRLAPELLDALASDDVVGVVLNAVDDALADGREGVDGRWSPDDIPKLPDLLNAARDHGRPVVLVSDHGHVLDRTPRGSRQADVESAGGARWRIGTPGDGEVELAGPRVRTGSGRITAAWRADVRYTARQAGYHGGASLGEVTVPVITLVPSADRIPAGWTLLPAENTVPPWWHASQHVSEPHPGAVSPAHTRGDDTTPVTQVRGGGEDTASRRPSPGGRTVRSAPYKAQRELVRFAPSDKAVAAVLDALLAAGGKLSPGAVAAAAQGATGKSQRNPERFATVLERLLNIDGYPVLQLVESGRTVHLDKELLYQQFLEGST